MKEEYDFSNSIKTPYVQKEKKQIFTNIDKSTFGDRKLNLKK